MSDPALSEREGAGGDDLIEIEIDEPLIDDLEVIEEGKPYREWIVGECSTTWGSVRPGPTPHSLPCPC